MNPSLLLQPWAPEHRLFCVPGRLVVKLSLGEAPEEIPTVRDVSVGAVAASSRIDGGAIDRVLGHFTDRLEVSRVHGAAASRGQYGRRHTNFNDMEVVTGLSRTFRVDIDADAPLDDAVDAVRQIGYVDSAIPFYLSTQMMAPVTLAPPTEEEVDLSEAWEQRRRIGLEEALAREPGDTAVIVAVVDTGIVRSHPELPVYLRAGYDTVQIGARDLPNGMTLFGDLGHADADPDDEVGHGTACAAIIGGRGHRLPPGVAGRSSVLPMRVLASARVPGKRQPIGVGALTDIDDGVKRAIDLGATVINMSFGTPLASLESTDPWPHTDVVRYGLARGCVLVAASGNSGLREYISPAVLEEVIAVGAAGSDGRPAAFSSSGDHVDIAAPGERVISAGLDGYQAVTGTSFAAPFVAGAAALLVARARRHAIPLGSAAVKRLLCSTARPWPPGTPPGHGVGTLDAAAALARLDEEIERSRSRRDSTPPDGG